MPKVLRILNRFNLGGPVYNASYLTADLSPEFETLLVGGQQDEGEISAIYIPETLGITPQLIPSMERSLSFKRDRKAYRALREIMRSFQPDIVHTHASKAGALGRLAARKEGVPRTVHTFHGHVFEGYFHPAKTRIFKGLERRLAAKTDAIVAISELQKQELCFKHRICAADKTHVIPLGFDLGRFHPNATEQSAVSRERWGIRPDALTVGIIGRLAPVKDHATFLSAFSIFKKRYSQSAQAVIVGDGTLKSSLQSLAKSLGLTYEGPSPDIVFTSWVTEMETILPALDIVALTSKNEGTPVSLIEAQAAAIPVVSTDVGGVRDVVLHGRTGLIALEPSAQCVAENILHLANNQSLRQELGANGLKWSSETFGRARLAEDMAQLYRSLL